MTTTGVAGLVASGVSIGAAVPTFGATAAFSIVGALKQISSLAQEIDKLARSASQLQKKLARDIPKLHDSYLRATGKTKKYAVALVWSQRTVRLASLDEINQMISLII